MKRSFLDQNSNVFFATQPSQTTPRSQIAQDVPSLSFCLEHKDRKGEERARVCKRSVEASFHSRIERERIRWRGWCKGCRSLRGIIHAISPQAAQWARHLDNKQRRHNYSIPPLRVVVGVEFRSFAPSLHHPPWSSNSSHVPRSVVCAFQRASVGSSLSTDFHPRSIKPWLGRISSEDRALYRWYLISVEKVILVEERLSGRFANRRIEKRCKCFFFLTFSTSCMIYYNAKTIRKYQYMCSYLHK